MRKTTISVMGSMMLLVTACGGPTPDAKEATADSASAPTEAAPPTSSDMPPVDAPASSASAAMSAPISGPTTLTGMLLGKEFKPVSAFAMAGAKPGTVLLEIHDQPVSCGALPPTPGAQKLGLSLAWKEGVTEAKTLKGGKEPEAFVMLVNAQKKFDRKDWKSSGSIEILKAPKKGGDLGRIKLDTKQGKDTLVGEIDVKLCGDIP